MNSVYLCFNTKYSLKMSPTGCEVLNGHSLVMPGNHDLGTFLCCCDGSTSLEEIIKRNTDSPENFQAALVHIGPLVEELLKKDVISLSNSPKSKPIVLSIKMQDVLTPSVVALELTNRCNLECVYCYQECSPSGDSYLQDPMQILEFLKQIEVRGIEFTGGEPTLHPQFMSLLEYACKNFSFVALITNGTRLTERLMRIMQEGPAQPSVQICLDGPDKETVDRTDGKVGSWEKIIQGIKLVTKHKIPLRVGMVLDSESKIDMIEDTLKIAKKLGAARFVATPAIDFGRSRGGGSLSPAFISKFIKVHQPLKRKYGSFYASESEVLDTRISVGCGAGQREVTVSTDGLVKMCSLQPAACFNFGHIMDIRSPAAQERFSTFSQLTPPNLQSCRNCEHLSYCMNCITRAFSLLSSGSVSKEGCQWHKENAELMKMLEFAREVRSDAAPILEHSH